MQMINSEAVMPIFPAAGSVRQIGDCIVVKLSTEG